MTGFPLNTLGALAAGRREDLQRSASRRRRRARAAAEADQVIDLSRFEDELTEVVVPPKPRPATFV